jgi:hypothetical protein
MKQFYRDRFQVAPFSVLVDVNQVRTLERLRKSLSCSQAARFPENVMYIYEKQLEEADLIVLNKADLLAEAEVAEVEATLKQEFTQAPVITISALHGTGVDVWLDHLFRTTDAGRTIADVDYDDYAAGEAALGWLNAVVRLQSDSGIDCRGFCTNLLTAMRRKLQQSSAEVAHLKLRLTADRGALNANLTSNDGEPSIRGDVAGFPREAVLLVNVRAKIDPEPLRAISQQCIADVAGTTVRAETEEVQSFSPSRPAPTHRFQSVV